MEDSMKKNNYMKALLLTFLIAVLAVSLISCGGKKEGAAETAPAEAAEEQPAAKTIEAYYTAHPEDLADVKKQVLEDERMQETLKVLDFDVYPEDNVIVYEYKYKDTYSDEQVATLKSNVDNGLATLEDSMKERIKTIEDGYKVENVVIHIKYLNGDGKLISEKYYTK